FSFIVFSLSLVLIGFAKSIFVLIIAIFMFSFCMRILNISMNTQSLTLQKSFPKKIIGSFHGLWSSGGLAGVAFSTVMISFNIPLQYHMLLVAGCALLGAFVIYRFLLRNDRASSGNKLKF